MDSFWRLWPRASAMAVEGFRLLAASLQHGSVGFYRHSYFGGDVDVFKQSTMDSRRTSQMRR